MRIVAVAIALCAGLALGGMASAQTPAAASTSSVGVLDRPCDALPPMPPEVADYMARLAKAQAARQPAPVPTAAAMSLYARWQQARQASDFGDLCHYADANAQLGPASSRRVVFFGDSITEFWKVQDPAAFSGDVLDRGVSGQTTAQMLIRFREDVINLNPRVVQIMAGTNDVAGNTGPTSIAWIENNVRSMVEQAKAHHIKVLLASVPPAARFGWRPAIAPVPSILALNAWLRAYARQEGLIYVDYYAVLVDDQHGFKAAWSADGVHPNAMGYAAMDPLAKAAIAKALRSRW